MHPGRAIRPKHRDRLLAQDSFPRRRAACSKSTLTARAPRASRLSRKKAGEGISAYCQHRAFIAAIRSEA